jgi:hypothetical protein
VTPAQDDALYDFIRQLQELRTELDAGMSQEGCQTWAAHIALWATAHSNELGMERLNTFAGFAHELLAGSMGETDAKARLDAIIPLLREPPVSN